MTSTSEFDRQLSDRAEQIIKEVQALGLDPYPTVFEIVPESIIYELASYVILGHYSHWSYGREYQVMKTMHQKGRGRIYETVINTDTCQAYLLDSNDILTNTFVVAHVYGHADFFANNAMYAKSPRRMDVAMQAQAAMIRGYETEYGADEVEGLLDDLHSIRHHVDPFTSDYWPVNGYLEPEPEVKPKTGYEDLWSDSQVSGVKRRRERRPYTPYEPDKDLMRFIMLHSPILDDWQKNVAEIVREESLYFYPNRRTKVCNEGWATLTHTIIMNRLDLSFGEHVQFARTNAGVTAQPVDKNGVIQEINPYFLGYNILDELNRRFGGSSTELAPEMLAIRSYVSDAQLLRDYLDEQMLIRLNDGEPLGLPQGYQPQHGRYYWEDIRDGLVSMFSASGTPDIEAIDGDYKHSRQLYLRHNWTGHPLDIEYAQRTMEHIFNLWGRTVWLETRTEEDRDPTVMIFDSRKGHRTR